MESKNTENSSPQSKSIGRRARGNRSSPPPYVAEVPSAVPAGRLLPGELPGAGPASSLGGCAGLTASGYLGESTFHACAMCAVRIAPWTNTCAPAVLLCCCCVCAAKHCGGSGMRVFVCVVMWGCVVCGASPDRSDVRYVCCVLRVPPLC